MHVEWVVNPRNPSFRRLNKKGSYTHNPVFLSEAEGSFGWSAGFYVAEVIGESTAGFIINKLKFVNNPFGAASRCDSFKFCRRHISDSNSLWAF